MALAHDATTVLSFAASPSPVGIAHTPGANPRGVGAIIFHGDSGTDMITSVGYGGVTMARVVSAADTATEPGRSYAYFLGNNIPTGTQTLLIAHNGAAVDRKAVIFTIVASSDLRVFSSGLVQENAANPNVTITTPREALMYCGIYSGLAGVNSLGLRTNMTGIGSQDFGSFVGRVDRQTNPTSGSFTMGYSSATDDVAFVTIALMEEEILQRPLETVPLKMAGIATTTLERQEAGVLLSDSRRFDRLLVLLHALILSDIATADRIAAPAGQIFTRLLQDGLAMSDPSTPLQAQDKTFLDNVKLQDGDIKRFIELIVEQRMLLPRDEMLRLREKLFSDLLSLADTSTAQKISELFLLRLIQENLLTSDASRRERSSLISDVIRDIDEGSLMRVRSLLALQNMRAADERKSALDRGVFERAIVSQPDAPLSSFDHVQAESLVLSDSATAAKLVAQIILRLIQDSLSMSDAPLRSQINKLIAEALAIRTGGLKSILGLTVEQRRLFTSDAVLRLRESLLLDRAPSSDAAFRLTEKSFADRALLSDAAVASALVTAAFERIVADRMEMADRRLSDRFHLEADLTQVRTGELIRKINISSEESITLSELQQRLRGVVAFDRLTPADRHILDRLLLVLERVILSDAATADKVSAAALVERLIADALALRDAAFRDRMHLETDRTGLAEAALREKAVSMLEAVLTSDRLLMETVKVISETIQMRDAVVRVIEYIRADRLILSDAATATFIQGAAGIVERLLQDRLDLSDRILRATEKTVQDMAQASDLELMLRAVTAQDAVAVRDLVLLDRALLLIADAVMVADAVERIREATVRVAEVATIMSDAISRLREMRLVDTMPLADQAQTLLTRFIVETLFGIKVKVRSFLDVEASTSTFFLRSRQIEDFMRRTVGVGPE